MKTVTRRQVGTIHMVQGGEKTHPIIILNGIIKEWVGFGWIGEDKATKKDKQKYPTVKD